jgi:hypothetical protein
MKRLRSRLGVWSVVALSLLARLDVCAQDRADPAAWMHDAKLGVMTHYLADWIARRDDPANRAMSVARWNELVDHFDVEALAAQIESTGARYLIFTIGQNSGYYCSPNSAYDRIVGINPSKCAHRDLIADLAKALSKRGIRLIVYLPAGAPSGDRQAREKLQWQPGAHPNREFQLHWEQIIREWSNRWGTQVHGWWFDGCYWPNTMYRSADPPNFASFAAAARAGNPGSAVAFNPGVVYRTISITPDEDFIAGEIDQPDKHTIKRAAGGLADGTRLHMLSFLGQRWGTGAPRFTVAQAIEFTKPTIQVGGFVTWDVPIQSNGTIAQPFLDQLKAIGETARNTPVTQPSTRPTTSQD